MRKMSRRWIFACRIATVRCAWPVDPPGEWRAGPADRAWITDPMPDVRAAAAVGLPAVATAVGATAIVGLLADSDPRIRDQAGEAAAALGEATVPLLATRLQDPRESVRTAAARALGRIGGEGLGPSTRLPLTRIHWYAQQPQRPGTGRERESGGAGAPVVRRRRRRGPDRCPCRRGQAGRHGRGFPACRSTGRRTDVAGPPRLARGGEGDDGHPVGYTWTGHRGICDSGAQDRDGGRSGRGAVRNSGGA